MSSEFKLTLTFDPATQRIGLEFNPQEFKTWEFVVGVLEAAKTKAANNCLMGQQQAAAKAMMQAAQEQNVVKNILRGN